MSVECLPLGVRCNLRCTYCYQDPMRGAAPPPAPNLQAIQDSLLKTTGPFAVFGGEPLLLPLPALEALLEFATVHSRPVNIQTNGTLITNQHIALFVRYQVGVGLSMDGPGDLNRTRWAGTEDATRRTTARSEAALAALCRAGRPPGLIVTLTRWNAAPDRLPILQDWFRRLDAMGVRDVRLHLLEVDTAAGREVQLSVEDTIQALRTLRAWEGSLAGLRFDLFKEGRAVLDGNPEQACCIWHGCDPYATPSVHGIDSHGQVGNCGRTNKDGVAWLKADQGGKERTLALYHTPQEAGGCQGCRFFLACQGGCPGTGIGGDWRNRTDHCPIWQAVLTDLETDLVAHGRQPISLAPDRNEREAAMLTMLTTGYREHGDSPHGDRPHGDSHGDHTDAA